MAYTISPHLEHIEWEDGTRSYCRGCDDTSPFEAVKDRPGYVRCQICGRQSHAGNLIINGARR